MSAIIARYGVSVAAIAVGLLIAASGALRPAQPAIEVRARELAPSPTAVIYVHVDGAVAAPGVVALPVGSRVFEAIDAAGGAIEEAETRELNLAARVADGQKLVIPSRRPLLEEAATAPSVRQPAPLDPPPTGASTEARINLNTASRRMLESLPGIGPVTAERIIAHREANGPFTRVDQLREARLVNAPTFERVRGLVSVD